MQKHVLENVEANTQKQKENAKIDIIKKQLQLRLPSKRIVLSSNGQKRSSEDLKKDLEGLIIKEHEEAKVLLIKGVKVTHVLQEDNSTSTRSYEGEIVDISGSTVSIKYDGYDSVYTWDIEDLALDILQGDLNTH